MILRRSEYVHLLMVSDSTVLAIHAVTQLRLPLAPEVGRLIEWFERPRGLDAALPMLAAAFQQTEAAIRACVLMLHERGLLSDVPAEVEQAAITGALAPAHGRDPAAVLDALRRSHAEGSHPYWAVAAPRELAAAVLGKRLDVLLFGECDVQMETDFLRREAAARGVDLRAVASFPNDVALAGERRHDAVIIGALQARHAIVLGDVAHHDGDPSRVYVAAVRAMIERLRALTAAPILVDGLPEPTLQPLGAADRGVHSHRNRVRRTNLALEEMAEGLADVIVVDVAAALGAAGAARLVDDGLVSFTHFGSPGWLLQRPAGERAAVHDQFPDLQPLVEQIGADPYQREALIARAHMDLLTVALGLGRKKCVIVDLDGVLWPGVLAETGSPFAWAPDVSGPNSYIGLYFGIHEALLALRRRGVLLACVSKNDEATVRSLWRYPEHYPRHRLLTPESFVTWRVNWEDKAANIRAIADELGFAMDAFMFVDDSARERERVRLSLPEVALLGDDLFSLRRALLTDPRLQPPRLTAESAARTDLVRAQIARARGRAEAADEDAFVASLAVACAVERVGPSHAGALSRVRELFDRTTQFNTTGRRFTEAALAELAGAAGGAIYTLRMRDRLAEHGLVGAAVVQSGEVLNFAMSCRVIGLGGEAALLGRIVADAASAGVELRGQIVASERNLPARHLYRQNGFDEGVEGWWAIGAPVPAAAAMAAVQGELQAAK